MQATPNTQPAVLRSITLELEPEEALAILTIVGNIGHDQIERLIHTELNFEQKKALRDLSTTALWRALKGPLGEHGMGNFDERDLDERERLNLVDIGVLD